jgi:hypothetical protein
LLAICATILAVQLLAPPFIGLASNGDFPKVTGRLSLGPREGLANFIYFVPDYVRSARFYWKSDVLSTELPLAWLATRLAGATGEGAGFDIRWLGVIHALLLLAALYVLIRSLRGLPGWRGLPLAYAAIFIFTDVEYVAYCNSFYSDAAAQPALLLMTALAVHIALTGMRTANAILFCLAALLFIGSKTQHAMWGFLPAAFLAVSGRWRGFLLAATLLGAAATAFWLSPPDYSAQALFNVVFSKLAVGRPEVLAELGLPAEDAAFIGLNAFSPGAPSNDPKWFAEFNRRTNYKAVLCWYLRHPGRALGFLEGTLIVDAPQMQPENLSNFRREDARPPGARTRRFALWSDFRSALLRVWPYHMVVWYLLAIAGSVRIVCLRRTPAEARLGWIALGIAAMAIGEFCVASLADAEETYRHLFVFQACTDLTVCFAIAASLKPRPAPAAALP